MPKSSAIVQRMLAENINKFYLRRNVIFTFCDHLLTINNVVNCCCLTIVSQYAYQMAFITLIHP